MILVIDQAAGTEYHRFRTTFFNLKRASLRRKSLTPQHHTGTFLLCFFLFCPNMGPSEKRKQQQLLSWSSCPRYSHHPFNLREMPPPPSNSTTNHTHTHTLKMRVNPIKRDGLLHAQPPFPPSASTSSDQRGGFIIW